MAEKRRNKSSTIPPKRDRQEDFQRYHEKDEIKKNTRHRLDRFFQLESCKSSYRGLPNPPDQLINQKKQIFFQMETSAGISHPQEGRGWRLENYRPVSHLVQVGMMVKYAVYFLIVDHFTQQNLFHPNNHRSLAHHSTATAVIQLFDTLLEAAENQELSTVCFLDQSAAYDLLCQTTLEEKHQIYNCDQSSIHWIMQH